MVKEMNEFVGVACFFFAVIVWFYTRSRGRVWHIAVEEREYCER